MSKQHECPRCGASRSALADELRTLPLGAEGRTLAAVVANNCSACRPIMRRWWRTFGWRNWIYRTVKQAEDLVAAVGGV